MASPMTLKRVYPDVVDLLPDRVEDTIEKEYRKQVLAEDNLLHDENRKIAQQTPLGFGMEFVSGLKGRGKTTFATMQARKYFRMGYMVITNGIGVLEGWIADDKALFTLNHTGLHHLVVIIDEVHNFAQRRTANAVRQRAFVNALSGLRKQDCYIIMMSSQEDEVAHNVLRECEYFHYPMPTDTFALDDYPDWAHCKVETVGPYPIRGSTVGEQYGVQYYDEDCESNTFAAMPSAWYDAAACQNSYQEIKRLVGGKAMDASSMWDLVASEDDIALLDEYGNPVYDVTEDGQMVSGETDAQDTIQEEYAILGMILKAYNSGHLSVEGRTPMARLKRVVRDEGGPVLTDRAFENLLLSYQVIPVGENKLVVPEEFAAIYRYTKDTRGNPVWRPPQQKELAGVV